jgi:hypothetical protein
LAVPNFGFYVTTNFAADFQRAGADQNISGNIASQEDLSRAPDGITVDFTAALGFETRARGDKIISEACVFADLQNCARDAYIIRDCAVDNNTPPGCDQVSFHRPVDGDDRAKDNQVAFDRPIEGEVVGDDIKVVINHFISLDDNILASSTVESLPRRGKA